MKMCTMLACDKGPPRDAGRQTRVWEADAVRTNSRRVALAVASAIAFTAGAARADDYPSHPIRLIVPYAAGGAADAVARIIGKRVGEALGQPVVVEDRGGGGGIIGAEIVRNADA